MGSRVLLMAALAWAVSPHAWAADAPAGGSVAVASPAGAVVATSQPTAADIERATPLPNRKGGIPATTQPAAGTSAAAPSDPFDLKRIGVALAIVVGVILVSQRVWKRMGLPGAPGKGSGALQIVSRMTVGPRQQVMLLRVGRRCVLVANSGTQMTPLAEISDPDEVAALLGNSGSREAGESSFDTVLSGAEQGFGEELAAPPPAAAGAAAALNRPDPRADEVTAPELVQTRQELGDLMERVRSLSKQFQKGS